MTNFWNNLKEMWNPSEESENYENEEFETKKPENNVTGNKRSKIVNIHKNNVKIVCFKPQSYDKEILSAADGIIEGSIVVLDLELEQTKPELACRIIDFLRGVVYAKGGKFMLVARNTYVLSPNGVEITGSKIISKLEQEDIYF
ncbi:MAG: cell division protein SepF [Oscillospiraceae bacterium]|nr:cell division protein SepF [Oscillospiraceae bacterium]